jgi:hypothetical protein
VAARATSHTARGEREGGIASAPIAAGGHAWAAGHRVARNGTAVKFVSVVRMAGETKRVGATVWMGFDDD